MKKYGVYSHVKGSNFAPMLIREFDMLKDAVREAYRLARCNYRNVTLVDEFIVGNNTGVVLNPLIFNERIRYVIEQGIIVRSIQGYWCNESKHNFLVKAGIV